MKKLIVLSMIMALMLLAGSSFTLAQPQAPANEEKPTFYRLTPGVYVNGWPRFTVTYPKDWVERFIPSLPTGLINVGTPGGPPRSYFGLNVGGLPIPFDKFADTAVSLWRNIAKDVTIVSDKPSQLRDGTPAREIELQMERNGEPFYLLGVTTKRGDVQVLAFVSSSKGKIGEDLKAIPYSLEFQAGKDEPVKVPPDIQVFLDKWCGDKVSHDVAKLMTHYSDRFLNSGQRKGEMERFNRQYIGSVTSFEVVITDLVPAADKVYLAGFVIVNGTKWVLEEASIIKESGEWKWYGNQRDAAPW